MHLVLTHDFETVKNVYLDVIENSPNLYLYACWEYGKHPNDELLRGYIGRDEMYLLTDGETIAGVTAVAMSQGRDYESISWHEDLRNDEAATLHLLAVCPAYRHRHLGFRILEEALAITVKNGKKALRLDTLQTNLPAQKMYEQAGFSLRGEQTLQVGRTRFLDFVYYEKLPGQA